MKLKNDTISEIYEKNWMKRIEAKIGQEGIDFTHINYEKDPNYLTQKKLSKLEKKNQDQLDEELRKRKIRDPYQSKAYEQLRQSIKRISSIEVKADQVKFYPGSEKGLTIEEDPEHFNNWGYENMPEDVARIYRDEIVKDEINRRKNIPRARQERTMEMRANNTSDWDYFINYDKEFRLCDQTDMPTWEIIEEPEYNYYSFKTMDPVKEIDADPELIYHYDEYDERIGGVDMKDPENFPPPKEPKMKKLDLSIIPYKMPIEFIKARQATEKWSGFVTFPEVMYEISRFAHNLRIQERTYVAPEMRSLWAYYETLPQW
jgi:hypothetical protein